MKIQISFELESGVDDAQMISWLNGVLAGEAPVKAKKTRKARKPLSDAEKKAFRKKMVAGQKAAAKARENGDDEVQPDPEKIAKAEAAGRKARKKPASKKKKKK